MSNEFVVLIGTAATIGFVHTIVGPDHYLPFIMLSRARRWNVIRTVMITFLCGIGHVLSSVLLGFIGIALGVALFKLEAIESMRGEIASWLLIIFGFTYCIWGIRRAIQDQPHKHIHFHENRDGYIHSHELKDRHIHSHDTRTQNLTPLVLFTIFIFGPCEPLIPLIMYPAAKGNIVEVAMVASIFGLVTIGTMLSVVLIAYYGLSNLQFNRFERYSHALAGLLIFLCGGAIKFLGL
jgi:sulfite exporter TauE/SafE